VIVENRPFRTPFLLAEACTDIICALSSGASVIALGWLRRTNIWRNPTSPACGLLLSTCGRRRSGIPSAATGTKERVPWGYSSLFHRSSFSSWRRCSVIDGKTRRMPIIDRNRRRGSVSAAASSPCSARATCASGHFTKVVGPVRERSQRLRRSTSCWWRLACRRRCCPTPRRSMPCDPSGGSAMRMVTADQVIEQEFRTAPSIEGPGPLRG
jgi:hypothetical protein